MISKTFVADLVLDTHLQSTFLASAKSTRMTRSGNPYLCVTLTDRTGSIEARAWDNAEQLGRRFDADDFVAVSAAVTSYQDTLQLKLLDIERVDDDQIELADYLPTSRWDPEALWAQLKELILEQVRAPLMRSFFKTLFGQGELTDRFKRAPAAKSNHHDYIGGLLEHVLSMARVAVDLADHYARYYPGLINKDLLLAGCVLHDLGKCRELSYSRSFHYTTHGQLIGHIPHGIELVNDIVSRMQTTPPEEMILQIKHLILSHHGRLDYGSPVRPRTPEAMLLHQIDMIDSRMNMCAKIFDEHADQDQGPDRWTGYHRALETRIYLGGEHDDRWRHGPQLDPDELMGPGVSHPDAEPDRRRQRPSFHQDEPPPRRASGRPRRPRAEEPEEDMTLNLFGD